MLDFARRRDEDDEADMTPLIDVVFILLLFFIIAAAFAVRGLDVELPQAQSSQAMSGRVWNCACSPTARSGATGAGEPDGNARPASGNRSRFPESPGQLVLQAAPDAPGRGADLHRG
jgi:biopolymer transport protein ExbD